MSAHKSVPSDGPLVRSGPWGWEQAQAFLRTSVIPLRLATSGRSGPLVQSLWYVFDAGALWCATQDDAVVTRRLRADPIVGFEVAGDLPPYRGLRGQARAAVLPEQGSAVLARLLDRYLTDGHAELRTWLESRAQTEVALRLQPSNVTSWDYTGRMSR